ncbi:MAG: ribosomal protein S18-alanine N-acetyltransferase [Methanobacteriota archaeon]
MLIRKFQPDDMFAVIKIAYTTLPEQYNPVVFNHFYENFPDGFLVAEHQQHIIGFLVGIKTLGNIAKILMISVEKQHRKKGIGGMLLTRFFQEIRPYHVEQIDLEVRTINTVAISFYKNHGFSIIDTIPGFYQNDKDAYLMRRKIH